MDDRYARTDPCVCGFGEEFFTLEGDRHICTVCGGVIQKGWTESLLESARVAPRKTVLIVDDQAFFRERIKETLGAEGNDILEASDGVGAIKVMVEAAFRTKGGPAVRFDAVILDLVMPGVLDGSQALAVMKALFPEVPVIILTASPPTKDLLKKLAGLGAKKYLNKGAGNLDQLVLKNVSEL